MSRQFNPGRISMLCFAIVSCVSSGWAATPTLVSNPTLRTAQIAKQNLETREDEVIRLQAEMVAALQDAVENFDPTRFEATDNVIRSLQPLVRDLYKTSEDILKNEEAYLASLKQLHNAISSTPETFRAAGRLFDDYAAEEPFAEIKEDYLTLADSWRLMAVSVEQRGAAIVQEGNDMVAFKKHLVRSSLFLKRLDEHLSSYPDLSLERDRQQHLARMQRYAKTFEALRGSLRSVHDKLKVNQQPSSAPASDPTPIENSGDHPTLPTVEALLGRELHRTAVNDRQREAAQRPERN